MVFLSDAMMEMAMNGFRKSGLWGVHPFVFMDVDFAPSIVTDRPGAIQQEKPTGEGTENFILSSARASKPASLKQTPGYNGYIHVEKISTLPSNCAQRPRPKPGRKHCASGTLLTRISHKESLNRPNIIIVFGSSKEKENIICKNKKL
jgi:hypothetical protein